MSSYLSNLILSLRRSAALLSLAFLSPILLFFALKGAPLVIWIALVPWFVFLLLYAGSLKKLSLINVLVGTLYASFIVIPLYSLEGWWWTPGNTFFIENRAFIWIGTVIVLTSLGGMAFFITGIAFSLLKKLFIPFSEISFFVFALIFSLVWTAVEMMREVVLMGLTWGHLGYLISDAVGIQVASIGGLYLLSFLVVFVNLTFIYSFFSTSFLSKMSTRTPPSDNGRENDPRKELRFLCKDQIKIPMLFKKSRSPSAWLSVVVMLSVIYGFGILNLFFLKEDPLNISVVVLASSYSTEESRDPAIFEEIIDVITNSVNNMHPDIIVLPENIFPFLTIDIKSGLPIEYSFGEEMPDVFRSIKELSGSNPGTTFLIGSHSVLFESNSQENKNDFSLQHPIGEHSDYDYFNSLIAVEEGEIRSFYHKRLLLLFSEWAPGFLGEHHMSPMSKGNKYGIETQHGNFGVFICSEISSSLYSRTPKRSVLLIVPSNDSVLPHPQTARYHHAKARIQAVTHSAPLLRSAKGGISSILDSRGRVIEKIDLSDRPFEKQKPSDPQNKEVGKSVIEILYAQL